METISEITPEILDLNLNISIAELMVLPIKPNVILLLANKAKKAIGEKKLEKTDPKTENPVKGVVDREETLWEKIVRLGFNPSGSEFVWEAKASIANVIDLISDYVDANPMRTSDSQDNLERVCRIAVERLEDACMWAVKAVTHK